MSYSDVGISQQFLMFYSLFKQNETPSVCFPLPVLFCFHIVAKQFYLCLLMPRVCFWLELLETKHRYIFPILTIHLHLLLLTFADSTVLFSNKDYIHMLPSCTADHLGCFTTLAPAVISSLTQPGRNPSARSLLAPWAG